MKRLITLATSGLTVIGLALLVTAMQVERPDIADDSGAAVLSVDDAQFIGAKKCRTCHRKPEAGEQFQKWEEGPHAKAYATLATDEAKELAAAKGIDDPQTADECLQCHVTGHGVAAELLGPKYSIEDGVSCESCHGAGGNYYKKKTMKAVISGEVEAASVGLVDPTEETCVKCHNDKSPSFKGFDFDEYAEKIAHPIPAETKAQYE